MANQLVFVCLKEVKDPVCTRYRMWMKERCQVKAPLVAEVAQRISWTRVWDACMDLRIIDSNISFMHACCIMGNNASEVLVPKAVVVDSESVHSGIVFVHSTHPGLKFCLQGISTYRQRKSYVYERERQLESLKPLACAAICRLASALLCWVHYRTVDSVFHSGGSRNLERGVHPLAHKLHPKRLWLPRPLPALWMHSWHM